MGRADPSQRRRPREGLVVRRTGGHYPLARPPGPRQTARLPREWEPGRIHRSYLQVRPETRLTEDTDEVNHLLGGFLTLGLRRVREPKNRPGSLPNQRGAGAPIDGWPHPRQTMQPAPSVSSDMEKVKSIFGEIGTLHGPKTTARPLEPERGRATSM